MKTVLITGASGFIAGHLARRLTASGCRVVGTSRSARKAAGFEGVYPARLGGSIDEALAAASPDVVVHAANASGRDEYRDNVEGTQRWFEEAARAGAGLQVVLGSLSASPTASAAYGRAKHALEKVFVGGRQVAFRMGVVAGNGGMFERIRRSVAAGPVVPMLDGGRARIYVVDVSVVCDIIAGCIGNNGDGLRGRAWNVQQPGPVTLRDLMTEIRARFGYRTKFVPVPSLPVLWVLSVLERLPVTLPVSATNIRGLRHSAQEHFASDYARFGKPEYTLAEIVDRAAVLYETTRGASQK